MGWTFVSGSGTHGNTGISTNGTYPSGGNPDTWDGLQVGFLRGTGTFSQPVTIAEASSLVVSFQAAQRSSGEGTLQAQEIQVSIGGTVVGPVAGGTAFTPLSAAYARFTTEPVLLPAGTHALTFTGLNPLGGDNTVFLDAVSLVFVPSPDDPFGYLGGLGYWQDPALEGSGLQYVRQRWLENGTGQWLSVDPIATEPRYGYAHNAPTMQVDPSGTIPPWAQKVLDKVEQVAHDSAKAFYTDRFDASDQEYQDVLDNIVEGLGASNASINATKQRILLHAEASVRNWAQRQSPKNASAFSEILAGILPFLPSAPHIPNTVLTGLDKVFAGKATQASIKASTKFDWLIALMPPEHGTKDAFLYQVGFLWGIFLAAFNYIDLISVVSNILSFALEIAKTEDIWSLLKEAALGLFAPILQATEAAGLSPFARGKLAATILTSLVLLIIDALDKARHITHALDFVKRVAGRFGKGGVQALSANDPVRQVQANLNATDTDTNDIKSESERQVREAIGTPANRNSFHVQSDRIINGRTVRDLDEAGHVLIDDQYIKNPTAKPIVSMIDRSGKIGGAQTNGEFMYVVNMNGEIIIGTRAGGHMPHPTLIGGVDPEVLAAGLVEIRAGRIYRVDNGSGHYQPSRRSLSAAKAAFEQLRSGGVQFRTDFVGYIDFEGRPYPSADL